MLSHNSPLNKTSVRKLKEKQEQEASNNPNLKKAPTTLHFLDNNINRKDYQPDNKTENDDDYNSDDNEDEHGSMYIDCNDEISQLTEEERRAAFQAFYKKEKNRQKQLLFSSTDLTSSAAPKCVTEDDNAGQDDEDDKDLLWEDG